MTDKPELFDPDPRALQGETFPAGKVLPDRGFDPDLIASDAYQRLKRLGLVLELVPLDLVEMHKLVRDRRKRADFELEELKASILELGLSNPVRLEARPDGRFELVQGFRRLSAYRALLEETGDADRFGAIPAAITAPGEGLDALYRRMVDENLVRKDISFAEMAQLAVDYAGDPQIGLGDAEKAVARLFKSASYQKRSYIRAFIPVVEQLGRELQFPEDIPRALGIALGQRLEEDAGLVARVRAALAGWDNRSVMDELGVLRRMVGQDGEEATPLVATAGRKARAKTSFQFERAEGRVSVAASVGRLEVRLDRDFSAMDRRKLELGVQALLGVLDR